MATGTGDYAAELVERHYGLVSRTFAPRWPFWVSFSALPLQGIVATSGVIAIVLGLALQNTLGDRRKRARQQKDRKQKEDRMRKTQNAA